MQVDVADGGSMTLDGKDYTLKQFHFHSPSEHTIEGKAAEMELHLVHADADGKLAVVGVMLNLGAANTGLEPVWAKLPAEANATEALSAPFDAATLLPAKHAAYRYQGVADHAPVQRGRRVVGARGERDPVRGAGQGLHRHLHRRQRPPGPGNGLAGAAHRLDQRLTRPAVPEATGRFDRLDGRICR